MQPLKSARHVKAANARWRAAEINAQAERDSGIPNRPMPVDIRRSFSLDLSTWGGPNLRIEPKTGYVAARAVDVDTGNVVLSCALKSMLHKLADDLPRTLALRNFL